MLLSVHVPCETSPRCNTAQKSSAQTAPGTTQGGGISLTLKRVLFENTAPASFYPMGRNTLTTPEGLVTGFEVELCPFHSPLLWTSRLISFLPLNKMLQFSGFSNISQDTKKYKIVEREEIE